MAKEKLKATGKTFENGQYKDADLEINMPNRPNTGVAGAGIPLSKSAFDEMMKGKDPNRSTTFSREAILTILSQYGCAGIKFIVANSPIKQGKETLIMVGVDDNNNTLLRAAGDTEPTLFMDYGIPPEGF